MTRNSIDPDCPTGTCTIDPLGFDCPHYPEETTMTDHNRPPVCTCPGDPSASAATWNPECRIHGSDANRHPHYRTLNQDERDQLDAGIPVVKPIPGWGTDRRGVTVQIGDGPALADTSPALLDSLRQLGAQYGPTGVARTARQIVEAMAEETEPDVPTLGEIAEQLRAWLAAGVTPESIRYTVDRSVPQVPPLDDIATAEDLEGHPLETLLRMAESYPPRGQRVPTGEYARGLLERVADLVNGPRNKDYGDALDNFTETGALWTVVLGPLLRDDVDIISAEQVALCMAQVKVARLIHNLHHEDSWDDGVGYLALGGGMSRGRRARGEVDPTI